MDLNALGNIGDFLGGIGVVITLVYLALQIRRNTRAMEQTSYLQNLAAAREYAHLVADNAEAASLMRRGMLDFATLSEDEKFQFNGIILVVFTGFEGHFYSWQRGFHGDEWWEPIRQNLQYLIRQPGVRNWWETSRPNVNPDFLDYVNREAERSDSGPAV